MFVRARGLGDISRLPIRRGQWTQSNYCCSHSLINLSLSLSQSFTPPSVGVIFFVLSALQRGMEGRKKRGSSDGVPHKKQERGGNKTQTKSDHCHMAGLREHQAATCT